MTPLAWWLRNCQVISALCVSLLCLIIPCIMMPMQASTVWKCRPSADSSDQQSLPPCCQCSYNASTSSTHVSLTIAHLQLYLFQVSMTNAACSDCFSQCNRHSAHLPRHYCLESPVTHCCWGMCWHCASSSCSSRHLLASRHSACCGCVHWS